MHRALSLSLKIVQTIFCAGDDRFAPVALRRLVIVSCEVHFPYRARAVHVRSALAVHDEGTRVLLDSRKDVLLLSTAVGHRVVFGNGNGNNLLKPQRHY